MDIFMIWIQDDGFHWMFEAWDSESIAANPEGWELAQQKAKNHGGPIRILRTHVDFDAVVAAFEPPLINSTPITKEES